MFHFSFPPGPLTTAGSQQLTLMSRQLAGLMQPIVTGAFGMVRAADGRPIIYSAAVVSAAAAAALQICGSPIPIADCTPCELTDDDLEVFVEVNGILLDPCDFEVTEAHACGDSPEGSGSSSSGSGSQAHAIRIKLKGKTEDVAVGKGDPVLCDNCVILETIRVLCFRNGLYTGHVDHPQECPEVSGGGGSGGV